MTLIMQASAEVDFFTESGEGSRCKIEEVIGKGSYGVVCFALDTHTGEKVAIKKINDIFEHVSDATRILREIKLLRLLHHPDIVEIKHILLPPSRKEFKDIYVVFELMESDLHQVIKANDDLTPEHYQFFLYQLLKGLKYIHTELLTGKPLFPGKNVVHQLDLMTDLLGTPSPEAIARVRNEKARRYLSSMRRKKPIPFSQKFPNADPLALHLLERMLAFEPKDRPTAEEALADPYFKNIAKVEREPSAQPVTKVEFKFESAVDHFKKQFAYLEENYGGGATVAPPERQHASLPRPSVIHSDNKMLSSMGITEDSSKRLIKESEKPKPENCMVPMTRVPLQVPQRVQGGSISPNWLFESEDDLDILTIRHIGSTDSASNINHYMKDTSVFRDPIRWPMKNLPFELSGKKEPRKEEESLRRTSFSNYHDFSFLLLLVIGMSLNQIYSKKLMHITTQKSLLWILFCMTGAGARPGKVVGSLLHYNNHTTSGPELYEQRRATRNPAIPTQYASSYPRRNPSCKSEREDEGIEGAKVVQPKPCVASKVVLVVVDVEFQSLKGSLSIKQEGYNGRTMVALVLIGRWFAWAGFDPVGLSTIRLDQLRLFFSYFKELVGKEVTVELKNDLAIRGILHSVDQYLNIKLENTRVVDQDKYPHMINAYSRREFQQLGKDDLGLQEIRFLKIVKERRRKGYENMALSKQGQDVVKG
ncbi:putative Serine/threonine protein kinase [Cocos nucifera]|uniref:Putative Serine/threonine protein kinase n=1 Tax=Cocos nucifera TaxID=13894 RepID=A0A8K0N0B6_COCNU|nr:putative Serine/threonine protein kinase [Cocos nucifera]